MKMFPIAGILCMLMAVSHVFAQSQGDNPNLDQIPQYLRERALINTDAPLSTVVTIDNWDNFSLGVDFAENNMAENPGQPAWYFTAYNINAPHNTENGLDWFNPSANFGTSVQGDPVVAYDSIGNLFYENMYGNITGCKVLSSTTNGTTWGSPVTAIAGADKNWLACDQTAGPFANYIYTTMTNSGYNAGNFARSTDHGLTFQQTFTATPHTTPGMMVCVGPDGNVQGGSVYVVTHSGATFTSTYNFFVSHDGGSTFTPKSSPQFSNTVGSQVGGRNSVQNMRTRPYPMIAADNSYGPNRGKLYLVYASNDPPGNGNKPDIFCRTSSDQGATWSNAVKVNDDPNTAANHQWHPAIWCDKETGKLYVMWMDTRDTPTSDSAFIYASYSTDGGNTFVANQRISNAKMKIDCGTCSGSGTPRYEGDYNGVVSNKKGAMIGWTDFRSGNFQSMTGYFPDFAMAIDHVSDTLYTSSDNTIFQVSIPDVKLYTDTVILSGSISPAPASGTITFEFPSGNTITSFPETKPVKVVLTGNVPNGNYTASFIASGPNGTPAHKRTAVIKVLPGNNFLVTTGATPSTICLGQSSQLNAVVLGGTPPYTYAWTPSANLSDPAIVNPMATPDITTVYHLLVTDNASNTTTDSVTVTVNTPPAAPGPIAGPQSVCADSITVYSIVEVVGSTTYSWTVQGDANIISGQNTPAVTIQWGIQSGNVQVISGNDCGNNPLPSLLPVTVNQPPVALNPITGPDLICINASATFTTPISGNPDTYTWTVPNDASITSGQGSNSINVTWGITAGTVTCLAHNGCGSSPEISKAVGVSTIPEPAGSITGKDTVCLGHGNLIYSVVTISGAAQYVWTLPSGVTVTAGVGTNQVTLSASATAQSGTISVFGQNDCGDGSASSKTLTVKNCAGIGPNNLESLVRLFPNPVSGILTIAIAGRENQLDLTLSDLNGKVLFSEKLTGISADYQKKINMSPFPKGVYFLKLSVNDRVYTEKVIVQ